MCGGVKTVKKAILQVGKYQNNILPIEKVLKLRITSPISYPFLSFEAKNIYIHIYLSRFCWMISLESSSHTSNVISQIVSQ